MKLETAKEQADDSSFPVLVFLWRRRCLDQIIGLIVDPKLDKSIGFRASRVWYPIILWQP